MACKGIHRQLLGCKLKGCNCKRSGHGQACRGNCDEWMATRVLEGDGAAPFSFHVKGLATFCIPAPYRLLASTAPS